MVYLCSVFLGKKVILGKRRCHLKSDTFSELFKTNNLLSDLSTDLLIIYHTHDYVDSVRITKKFII